MGTFKIELWGLSALATGDLAIIALTLVALGLLALRFHSQLRRNAKE